MTLQYSTRAHVYMQAVRMTSEKFPFFSAKNCFVLKQFLMIAAKVT